MEMKSIYFEDEGAVNTDATLLAARQRADALGIKNIVVASSTGKTAVKAAEVFSGYNLIVVGHVTGFRGVDTQEFTDENRKLLQEKGVPLVIAGHAFGGISKAMKYKFETYVIGDIMANTLYLFGQGTKVAVEIAMMAADAGLVETTGDAVCVAGTGGKGGGADTALVIQPAQSHNCFDLKVREVICKPRGQAYSVD